MDGPQGAQLVQDVRFVLFLAILNKATLNISAQDPCGCILISPRREITGLWCEHVFECEKLLKCYLKWLYPFTFPPAIESSGWYFKIEAILVDVK